MCLAMVTVKLPPQGTTGWVTNTSPRIIAAVGDDGMESAAAAAGGGGEEDTASSEGTDPSWPWSEAGLDYAVESGVVSKKTADFWKKIDPWYIPLTQQVEDRGLSKISMHSKSPFRKMESGGGLVGRKLEDRLTALDKHTMAMFAAADRNRIMTSIVDAFEAKADLPAKTRQATALQSVP